MRDLPQTESTDKIFNDSIIIKNIPLSYPEEDFKQLFLQLGIPSPWSFNYHYTKEYGIFRGLAFANFRHPFGAQKAICVLNNYVLQGRKLVVELKKKISAEGEWQKMLARMENSSPALTESTGHAVGNEHQSNMLAPTVPPPMGMMILIVAHADF